MAREAALFDMAGGNPLRGYLMLKQQGGNVPPNWIERSEASRKSRHAFVKEALQKGGVKDITVLEDWEVSYRKECFYRGIRILLELEREGKTAL